MFKIIALILAVIAVASAQYLVSPYSAYKTVGGAYYGGAYGAYPYATGYAGAYAAVPYAYTGYTGAYYG